MPLPDESSPTGDGSQTESALYDSTTPQFNPYDPPTDPESVQPTSPGPARSSLPAPGFGDTSGEDGEPQEAPQGQGAEEEQEPLPEFDERHREPFEGLLYLGRLQETFRLWGHTFVIRTLTTEELAEIGQIVKPHRGTHAENAVYQAALVAAAVVTVDGEPLPTGITVDSKDDLSAVKFPYVMRNWMPPVREKVYQRCFSLELISRKVLAAMGEASG